MRNTFFTSLTKETALSIFFLILALGTLMYFFVPQQSYQTIQKKIKGENSITTPTLLPTPKTNEESLVENEEEVIETKTQPPAFEKIQITMIVTPTPQPVSDKATISVSITGVSPFSIKVNKGNNHCEVLRLALSENKITQLLTKYDNSLGATGVYQINNLGKDNAVWWTYEVNGVQPATGCDHIAANNGDSVSWKYIGN